jgi:thymidylate synthase
MEEISFHDKEYLHLVQRVLTEGTWSQNRTGIRTKSIFGPQMCFDLRDGSIPLLTTKHMHIRSIVRELLWYLTGSTNIKYLQDHNVRIWDEWADEHGELGPVYGYQWRRWLTHELDVQSSEIHGAPIFKSYEIDQIAILIDKLLHNPTDRRMIVTAWNVGDLSNMKLPPCHYSFQCNVVDGELSMILNQRSCDVFLGVPFNVVQYSLLLRMLAEVTGLNPGELIWNGGNVHIYENHVDQCIEQLSRTPFKSPKFMFNRSINDIDDFKFEDFEIIGYESHPTIKATVAV